MHLHPARDRGSKLSTQGQEGGPGWALHQMLISVKQHHLKPRINISGMKCSVVSSAATCGQIELATAASAQESVASKLLYFNS